MSVLLTADRTLMSNYHSNEFIGFGTTAPSNVFPNWLYQRLFFPPIKTKKGIPIQAPYGLRKVEAQLLNEGFNVLTVDPDRLARYIDDAKVLGIYTMDPFGLGPSSTTFARILRTGEPYLATYFKATLAKPEIRTAKRRGLKIIVGGPGAWQLKHYPKFVDNYGVDCVIDGESEKVVGKTFKMAMSDEELPKFYEVDLKEVPSLKEIPDIKYPSINGLIEVGRGCCRGCQFCSVTLRPLRWYPYDKIEREIKVNWKAGIGLQILHAEDVLLYGSPNTMPNPEKVLKLHKMCKNFGGGIGWSHTSLASVAVNPKLVDDISDIIIDERQKWWGAEIGIETGSPELIRKAMPAKTHPFKPEEWPEVVKEAAGMLTDNNFVAACTLVVGLPQETEEDIIKTIELIDDLKDFKSVIVPLFFVPLGRLKDKDWFKFEQMTPLHRELLLKCLRHDIYWVRIILKSYFEGQWQGPLLSPFYRLLIWMVRHKAKAYL